MPDPDLLRRGEIFVAEGRLVVRALLTGSRFRARSILLTDVAYRGLADVLEPRLADTHVFVVPAGAIEGLSFTIPLIMPGTLSKTTACLSGH